MNCSDVLYLHHTVVPIERLTKINCFKAATDLDKALNTRFQHDINNLWYTQIWSPKPYIMAPQTSELTTYRDFL